MRTMARETGLSKSSVQRLWSAHSIAPHRLRSFKLSKDLAFEEKFWDVVGLYLNPPDRALLLCCDEKSQCQALERSQPGLPLSQGHIRTQTHDYYRHGTVTLFAALDYLSGKVFAHTAGRHRHQEWLVFLRKIEREVFPSLIFASSVTTTPPTNIPRSSLGSSVIPASICTLPQPPLPGST